MIMSNLVLLLNINAWNNLFKYSQLLNSLIKVIRRYQMAEAVKNNGRSRRPPSHLRTDYNEDNFQPGTSQYSRNREAQRQASDPCSILLMARLLSKFMASVNKKYLQSKALKAQQEANVQTKKQANQTSRSNYKVQKNAREERMATTPKAQNSGQMGTAVAKSKQTPQAYTNVTDTKQNKSHVKPAENLIKGSFPPDNLFSVQSMAKMSRQQLLKMVPKGIDPSLLKQHTKQLQQDQTNKKQSKQSLSKQQSRQSMCRPDSKLFKRAAFHIGIAYNIHIDKVKQENPNYTTDDLDPTLISRKMKMQSIEQAKRRMQQAQRHRQQQQILARQRALSQNRGLEDNPKRQTDKKPVFIEIEDENDSEMKPQKDLKEQPNQRNENEGQNQNKIQGQKAANIQDQQNMKEKELIKQENPKVKQQNEQEAQMIEDLNMIEEKQKEKVKEQNAVDQQIIKKQDKRQNIAEDEMGENQSHN